MKNASSIDYNPQVIEPKWREIWKKNKTFQVDMKPSESAGKAYYNLMMFPYPSAEGLHVGNMYAFTGSDIWGRYMQMKGHQVFEPIGLDGFGIHSENYAIKLGKHPADLAKVTEKKFYNQLSLIGNMFSWDNHLETYDPEYYKWTQWIFIQMFKAGLAYRKKASVNWCPSCKTVLADEQVIEEKCERCESSVEKKDLEQWFFRITDYADRLLKNLDKIDWSSKVLTAQRNWIGKSQGLLEYWKVEAMDLKIETFTTWPHTTWGATFIVIAPEHPIIKKLVANTKYEKSALEFCKNVIKENKIDPSIAVKNKKGFFLGRYAINHLTGEKMKLFAANFAVMGYGTGIVKCCPAHDQKDFEFAKTYDCEIRPVIVPPDGKSLDSSTMKEAYIGEGTMENAKQFNGMKTQKAKEAISDFIISAHNGKRVTQYHLRDWLISRQRYWGPPIPMINCPKCGWQPVSEKDLPVKLPYLKDYRPKGTDKGPLASLKDWVKTDCPKCGGLAQRETDVSDTFLDSAWYFLRYPSVNQKKTESGRKKTEDRNLRTEAKNPSSAFCSQPLSSVVRHLSSNDTSPWNHQITKRWLPVNMYIGGAEHAVLHLLYSRFLTMFFKDQGLLSFEEPFCKFRAHGLIIKDGAKMSKSKGNIVNPDKYISQYGADTLRCYLMFLGPLSEGGDFRDSGMKGMNKFLARVWRLAQDVRFKMYDLRYKKEKINNRTSSIIDRKSQTKWQHKTIKRVTEGIERLKYNTSIAGLMEYVNFLEKQSEVSQDSLKTLILLLAPFAPHLTEELWQIINHRSSIIDHKSVHHEPWPQYNPKMTAEDRVELVIQVNGKVRDRLEIDSNIANFSSSEQKQQALDMILKSPNVQKHTAGKTIKKSIFVPGKLVNLVV